MSSIPSFIQKYRTTYNIQVGNSTEVRNNKLTIEYNTNCGYTEGHEMTQEY